MILPNSSQGLYRVIKENISSIKATQKRISFYIESADSFPKCILLAFVRKPEKIMELYTAQFYNVSALNRKLPEAIYYSKHELMGIESRIDQLYANLMSKNEESGKIEDEIIAARAELTMLKASQDGENYLMKKSCLERKLSKAKQSFALSKDYISNLPAEISLLESQQKILQNYNSRCEYVLQKSKHIESILSSCLSGIKSINTKQDLMLHLGIAFTNINQYVNQVTDYTATELVNATSNFMDSSFKLDLALEDSSYGIEKLNVIEELE